MFLVIRDKKQRNLPESESNHAKMLLEKANDSSSARLLDEEIEICLQTEQAPMGECFQVQFYSFTVIYSFRSGPIVVILHVIIKVFDDKFCHQILRWLEGRYLLSCIINNSKLSLGIT